VQICHNNQQHPVAAITGYEQRNPIQARNNTGGGKRDPHGILMYPQTNGPAKENVIRARFNMFSSL
jgi:hypothetical protein